MLGARLEVEMSKKCTPLWREAHFEVKSVQNCHVRTAFGSCHVEKVHAVVARSNLQVKMYEAPQVRSTFGSGDVEKVHAVVARSTCASEHVKKHVSSGRLLEVEMWKKCTPLWREAHFQVKSVKN